jgi:hypothetical protein
MSALTILIVRHAEKPDDPSLGPGLTIDGAVDKHSLVVRGWQRAGAWTALFGSGASGPDYPQPIAIYAADPTAAPTENGTVSKRPHETILPLSQKLRLTPVTKYGVGDEVAMLDEVRALTGVVLIAWEHKRIAPAILPELAKGQSIPHLPGKWDGSRFDVVLRFDHALSTASWSFRQLFPRLLAGDLDVPL